MEPIKKVAVGKNQLWFLQEGAGCHGAEPLDVAVVEASLEHSFVFAAERKDAAGLRTPQLGALHAVLAHRSMETSEPITIVMPTGTGKTETMLAAYAHSPARTLVIVPSDALRSQIAKKFTTLGVLPFVGAVTGDFKCPTVGVIKSSMTTADDVDELVLRANVVVATPQALRGFGDSARRRLAELCDRLFIDEAHHVAANTWRSVTDLFAKKEVIQFTATPYREDGKHLNGRVAYAYPLRLAQQNGYFARINYHSIVDLADGDLAVATAAVAQLRADIAAGRDHVLMARVASISRAQDVIKYYEVLAPDLHPIRLDSKLSATAQREGLAKVVARASRVVVCVDMLGEGFDLPELKVAAIHDPHKSLAITLQFVGRFTRVGGDALGEASAFVPRQVTGVDDRLRQLYGQDADWNLVIQDLSERQVGREKERSDFERAFGTLPEEISMRSLRPKMSTVVYRSADLQWNPAAVYELFEESLLTTTIGTNDKDHVCWFVTAETVPVRWGEFASFAEVLHHLYVVHCDVDNGFMYINSSNNDLLHEDLATGIGGDGAQIMAGDRVYRVLAGIDRRVPTNVGLLDVVSQTRRFSMHTGQDVIEGFRAEAGSKIKTNIFAHGYRAGRSVSFGASRKGRVWSHEVAEDVHDWMTWARQVGPVITDEAITLESVMSGFLIPVPATTRPPLVPLAVEWPYHLTGTLSESRYVTFAGQSVPLLDVELQLCESDDSGPIKFELVSPTWRVEYEVVFHHDRAPSFVATDTDARIAVPKGEFGVGEFLSEHGVHIFFEQEAVVTADGFLTKPDREAVLYPRDALEVFDWSGINIRAESQGQDRKPDTVQYRAIQVLSAEEEWEVVIDDDGSGEMADVVLLRRVDDELHVLMVHCKYSSEVVPGARLKDLYEVCGQAIKSHRAKAVVELIVSKLVRRERKRQEQGRNGFVVGDSDKLTSILHRARFLTPKVTIAVVQPGVSKAALSNDMAELLGATERYLLDTYGSKFRVITSG